MSPATKPESMNTYTLAVLIPPDWRPLIERAAHQRYMSRAEYLRTLLRQALEIDAQIDADVAAKEAAETPVAG